MEPLTTAVTASAIASLFANKAVEKLGEGAGEAAQAIAGRLLGKLRDVISSHPGLAGKAAAVETDPQSPTAFLGLTESLEAAMARNPELKDQLGRILDSDREHHSQVAYFLSAVEKAITIGVNHGPIY